MAANSSHYPSFNISHIFHGAGDQIIGAEQAALSSPGAAGSVLHLVEDAGHMVTYADGAVFPGPSSVAGEATSAGSI